MRILLINDRSENKIGGAEQQVCLEKKLLRKNKLNTISVGFDALLKSGKNECLIKESRNWFIRKTLKLLFNPYAYYKLRRIINSFSPDVIHIHKNSKYPLTVLMACRDKKVIQTIHDYGELCPTGWCVKQKDLSECSGGIGIKCISSGCLSFFNFILYHMPLYKLRRHFSKKLICAYISPSIRLATYLKKQDYKNVILLRNLLDISEWKFSSKRKKQNILYVGALSKQKGVKYLIAAMKIILDNGYNANLTIIGSGNEQTRLVSYAEKLNILSKIEFLGAIPPENIAEYYQKASILVVPSIWMEQYGMVGPDALLSGTPCIGSNRGGIPEWLKHGVNGYLFRPGDSEQLAEHMIALLKNKKKARRFALNGRRFIANELNSDIYLKKIQEVFNEIQNE